MKKITSFTLKVKFIVVEIFSKGVLFSLIPLYRSSLTDEDYAKYASNFLAVSLISIFVAFSVGSAVVPFWKENSARRRNLLNAASFYLLIISTCITAPVAYACDRYFTNSGGGWILSEATLLFVLQSINLRHRLTNDFKMYAINSIGHSMFVVVGSFVLSGNLSHSTRIALSVSALIAIIFINYIVHRIDFPAFNARNIKISFRLVGFSAPVSLFLFTSFLRSGYERIFANKLFDKKELAELLYAGQLGTPLIVLISSVIVVLSPDLHKIVKAGIVKRFYFLNVFYLIAVPFVSYMYVQAFAQLMELFKFGAVVNTLTWVLVTSSLVYGSCAGLTTVYMYSKFKTKELAIFGLMHSVCLVVFYEWMRSVKVGVLTYLFGVNFCIISFYIIIIMFVIYLERQNAWSINEPDRHLAGR